MSGGFPTEGMELTHILPRRFLRDPDGHLLEFSEAVVAG
jgi:hypothetical protein